MKFSKWWCTILIIESMTTSWSTESPSHHNLAGEACSSHIVLESSVLSLWRCHRLFEIFLKLLLWNCLLWRPYLPLIKIYKRKSRLLHCPAIIERQVEYFCSVALHLPLSSFGVWFLDLMKLLLTSHLPLSLYVSPCLFLLEYQVLH